MPARPSEGFPLSPGSQQSVVVTMWPPAGTSASSIVVAAFMPELETRQSSAPSRVRIFSSQARVVGLP